MKSMPSPFIQIFILSRNRRAYLEESLNSCLKVSYDNYEIIVSDNSTNEDVQTFLSQHPLKHRFKVLRRNNLSYMDHTNTIISEVEAPYFMMFHDDDVLLPSSLDIYMNVMEKDLSLSAVGGNAHIIQNINLTEKLFMCRKKDRRVESLHEFIKCYFLFTHSHPAYPTYLFRTLKVKHLRLSLAKGGVHADTSFLLDMLNEGGLYFSTSVVAQYRQHSQNLSATVNVTDINNLTRYVIKQAPADRKLLLNYKYMIWIRFYVVKMRNSQLFPLRYRDKVMLSRSLCFFMFNPSYFCRKVFSKVSALIKLRYSN